MRNKWYIVFVFLYAVIWFAALLPAATYYVDDSGDNGNTGGIGDPWLTIEHALSQVSGGDTIYVRGGSGYEITINNVGFSDWVTIENQTGESVYMAAGEHYINMTATRQDVYIKLKGLIFQDAYFTTARTNHVILDSCTFEDQGTKDDSAIEYADNGYFTVTKCNISGTRSSDYAGQTSPGGKSGNNGYGIAYGAGIRNNFTSVAAQDPCVIEISDNIIHGVNDGIHISGQYVTIAGNTIYNCGSDGIYLQGINHHNPNATCLIADNHIYNLGNFIPGDHTDGLQFAGLYGTTAQLHNNMTVRRNIIHDSDQQGFFSWPQPGTQCKNWIFSDNVFYNCNQETGGASWAFTIRAHVDKVYFHNNTIENNVRFEVGSDYGYDPCVWIDNNAAAFMYVEDTGETAHGWTIKGGDWNHFNKVHFYNQISDFGANSVVYQSYGATPWPHDDFKALFNNYDSDDFDLPEGSALIDNGNGTYQSTTDVNGNTRDANPDISAYEFIADPCDTSPPDPDPMTWATNPYAASASTITMVATTAVDAGNEANPVEYFFQELSGNSGGLDSGWQTLPIYTNNGLFAETQYSYRVKVRDSSGNETGWSSSLNATTPAVSAGDTAVLVGVSP